MLSLIPAIGTELLGLLTGELLITDRKPMHKVLWMTVGSILLMIVGKLWNFAFPINKILWSSPFVCWVGELCLLLQALFFLIIDVWKFQKWPFLFVMIGMNPITIYLANRIIGWDRANEFLGGGIAALFPENWRALTSSIGYVSIGWLFLYLLYKNKIFP